MSPLPSDSLLTPPGSTAMIKENRTGVVSPYDTDETPLVSVTINGVESDLISQYCYDSDILQLGDPFSVVLPDPHNRYSNVVEGDPITLNMASPLVGNGQKVQKITGIVTQVMRSGARGQGNVLNIAGADLGWHLVNNDAPIWKRLAGTTFGGLYSLLVDSSWGFQGFAAGNDRNVKVKMGGNYARAIATLTATDKPPIVQIEPGDKPADFFIQYAKLANKLVNVSFDGVLQLFQPNYTAPVAFGFWNYAEKDRVKYNNVIRYRLTRALSGRYTKAVCVGSAMIPISSAIATGNDPNANSFRGTYTLPTGVLANSSVFTPLKFNRLTAFADPDRLNRSQAQARAKWKIQRGEFDSWVYEITVRGHSQGGNFYEPDTLAQVHDTNIGFEGKVYISAVQYNRSRDGGTTTTLTCRQPNLLAA